MRKGFSCKILTSHFNKLPCFTYKILLIVIISRLKNQVHFLWKLLFFLKALFILLKFLPQLLGNCHLMLLLANFVFCFEMRCINLVLHFSSHLRRTLDWVLWVIPKGKYLVDDKVIFILILTFTLRKRKCESESLLVRIFHPTHPLSSCLPFRDVCECTQRKLLRQLLLWLKGLTATRCMWHAETHV